MKYASTVGGGGTTSIPVNISPPTNTTTSAPAGGSSPIYTQPPATGTGVTGTGTLIPLDYIFIGLIVLVVAIIGVMLI